MDVPLTVNVPKPLNAAYEKMADDRLTSKSAVVREALLKHVQTTAPELLVQFARRKRKDAA